MVEYRLLYLVALFARAWIEIKDVTQAEIEEESPSSRGRGLKCNIEIFITFKIRSPSSRGRGLKYTYYQKQYSGYLVALFARAWIEMKKQETKNFNRRGRPLREGVD